MRTYLIRATALLAMLSLAAPAFAAYNDVTLDSNAVLTVNGIELDVTGSSNTLSSITVDSGSFTATVAAGSSLSVTAPNGNQLYAQPSDSSITVTQVCTASASTMTLSAGPSGTVEVTPSSAVCPATVTTGGGNGGNGPIAGSLGGGGGGGGGGGAVIYGSTPVPNASSASVTNTAQAGASAKFAALTRFLKKGSVSAQVKELQQMLNSDPDTQVAVSGVGSPGSETTLFGALTEAAVKKFQTKWGIVSSGTAATTGYGAVGPKTRNKLNSLFAY